jgi:hypothetical protein
MSQVNVDPEPVVDVLLTVPEHWSSFGVSLVSSIVARAVREAFLVRLKFPREPDERPLLRVWPVKRKPGAEFSICVTTPDCLLRPERACRSFLVQLALINAYVDAEFWADDLPDFQIPRVTIDGAEMDVPRPC